MAASTDRAIEVRAARPDDHAAVIELLSASLGWSADPQFEAFFAWKHERNPFGRSPAWVAVDDGLVVGFRTFLRWEHEGPDGVVYRTVRAVDTATRPTHRGRGIFRLLTLRALDDLRTQGTAFVFNTPNDQSRPGYLKMGWSSLGRVPITARITSPASPLRMLRSRVPAERWSTPSSFGHDAREVLADSGVSDLLATMRPPDGLRTHCTVAYLRWRYGFEPLAYRAVVLSDDVADGFAVFRLRRRGRSLECALCDVLVPARAPKAAQRLMRTLARGSGADYIIRVGGPPIDLAGFLRVPGLGPILTWRPLRDDLPGARLEEWKLGLGDVELF